MDIEIKGDKLVFYPKKSMYSQEVLFKCFYWYGSDFEVDIDDYDSAHYIVQLIPKSPSDLQKEIIPKIKRDLADYKLRDIVSKETQTIRELLVAKAFAYENTEVEYPDSEISDPVGFNPLEISHD